MKLTNWNENQKEMFLKSQHLAQQRHYKSTYPNASFDIIEIDNREAGRLYLCQSEKEVLVIDISLLPEFRGNGLGSKILKEIMRKAKRQNLPLRLSVFAHNKAYQLYKKLGFKETSIRPPYIYMEWN